MEDFDFYSSWYLQIRRAAETLTPGLEAIHYNAQNGFTLQYPVLLAPLSRSDSEPDILRKLRIVAAYLDITDRVPRLELEGHQLLHDAVQHVPVGDSEPSAASP